MTLAHRWKCGFSYCTVHILSLYYARFAIERMLKSERRGRSSQPMVDPLEMRQTLLKYHEAANYGTETSFKLQRNGTIYIERGP